MKINAEIVAEAWASSVIIGFIILVLLVAAIVILFWDQKILKREISNIYATQLKMSHKMLEMAKQMKEK